MEDDPKPDRKRYLDVSTMAISGKLEFTTGMEQGKVKSAVFYHASGELYAEDDDQHMAILLEIVMPTVEVEIEDIEVGDTGVPLTEDQDKLRQLI